MKKIAFISQSLAGGGQERVTSLLANGISKKKGYEIYLITAPKEDNEYFIKPAIMRHCILTQDRSIKGLFQNKKEVKSFLKDNKIDCAIAMGIYANTLLGMCSHGLKTKIIISERNDPVHDNLSWKSKLLRFLYYRNADGYVFQTEGARAFYSKKIQSKGVIIPNPIKADLPYKTDADKHEIVAVGRLSPQKNYPNLLQAFALVVKKHPEYRLRIFGKGEQEEMLKDLCQELKIADKVVFEGFCNNVHEQIKDSQIYVMSSDYEGMPNALMEAMAMGFPVVSTDCPCGGPMSLIDDGVNGYLVPIKNHLALAQKIIELIQNESTRKQAGLNAQRIRNVLSQDRIVEKWLNIINEVNNEFL